MQDEREIKRLLNIFARGFNSVFAATTPSLRVVNADQDDDKFIGCAVALDARTIISGDKALREVRSYMNIDARGILKPIETPSLLTPKQHSVVRGFSSPSPLRRVQAMIAAPLEHRAVSL